MSNSNSNIKLSLRNSLSHFWVLRVHVSDAEVASKRGIHPGFETQSRRAQKSKPGDISYKFRSFVQYCVLLTT